jgi:hypothetical protein
MERHQIIDAMTGLKLYGMRASFDEIAGKGLARRDELYPLLGSLIRAELAHRQSRSINYRISGARFPVLKDLEAFIFEGSPVDEVQMAAKSPCLRAFRLPLGAPPRAPCIRQTSRPRMAGAWHRSPLRFDLAQHRNAWCISKCMGLNLRFFAFPYPLKPGR